jgi:hypothetical protein
MLRLACSQEQCNYETSDTAKVSGFRLAKPAYLQAGKIKDLPGPVD